jgi:hypothetical protein
MINTGQLTISVFFIKEVTRSSIYSLPVRLFFALDSAFDPDPSFVALQALLTSFLAHKIVRTKFLMTIIFCQALTANKQVFPAGSKQSWVEAKCRGAEVITFQLVAC